MPPVTLPTGATWRVYTTADGLSRNDVRFVDVAADGTTWVLAGQPWGLDRVPHRFEDGRFSPHPGGCRIDPGGYQAFAAAPGGTAYARCAEIAAVTLRHFDGQRWAPIDLPPGSFAGSDMAVAPDGRLWIVGGDAVWAYDGTWQAVLARDRFGPIDAGPHGELWMQLVDAAARLDGDEWTDFSHERLRTSMWFESLVVGRDGSVWVLAADDDGIAWLRLVDGVWSVRPVDLDVLSQRVDPACVAARGIDPTRFDEPAELLDVGVSAVVGAGVAPDGALWTAVTCVGVGRLDPATGQTRQYTVADGLPSLEFDDLAVGVDGGVWVAGSWGLAHLG